ncbi:MAG: hypothetical protein H6755_05950 [Candidatus Omnitrophica bacterium]|nr:hypothetical protein [Candidatus Omnitrophota bacterium]MCB9747937.1 hypothetical protein [Candidatus Omnitrophota bacterium]
MKKILFSLVLCFTLIVPRISMASDAWAILWQTSVQTAEHIKRLNEAIRQIELLKQQVALATEAAKGLNGVTFISDFRNLVLETNDLLSDLDGYVSGVGEPSEEWKNIFGSLKDWSEIPQENLEPIAMSDDMSAISYKMADTYQDLYEKNSEYAQRFISNAKVVNEKGAMKQVAEELAHLMQMQNQVMYLMSQSVKQQSVEDSNRNLERKEEVVEQQKENEGVRRFMNAASRSYPM